MNINLGNKEDAMKHTKKALEFNSGNERIKNNIKLIENME